MGNIGSTNSATQPNQDSTARQTRPVASQAASQSHGFLSNFGRSSGPSSSYAKKTDKHLVLNESSTNSLRNAYSILGKDINYPTGEGQIYSIK